MTPRSAASALMAGQAAGQAGAAAMKPRRLQHHPGYVVRYDMWQGTPYYVPVGSPRNLADKEALRKYDSHAYEAPMQQFTEEGEGGQRWPDTAFDPDTGKRMPLAQLQEVLTARYPQQVSNDWDKGANLQQPAPANPALARTAQHVPFEGALPPPTRQTR